MDQLQLAFDTTFTKSTQCLMAREKTGIITGFRFPRTHTTEVMDVAVLNKFGVYILIGHGLAYVGRSDKVASRVRQHNNSKEPWWETSLVFVSALRENSDFGVAYLERALNDSIEAVGKYILMNKNRPGGSSVSHEASYIKILDNIKDCANFFGYYDLFSDGTFETIKNSPKKTNPSAPDPQTEIFELKRRDAYGRAIVGADNTFILLAGSRLAKDVTKASYGVRVAAKRKTLISKYKIQNLTTPCDIVFAKSSPAALFLCGTSVDGPSTWRSMKTGKP